MKTCLLYGPINFSDPDPAPPNSKSRLYKKLHTLLYELYQNGYGTFLCDFRRGADFWMGSTALEVKNRHPGMEVRRIFAHSDLLLNPEYITAGLLDKQCDAVWNLRVPPGYESEVLFLEDSPVTCDCLLFLYDETSLDWHDRWLIAAAQNIRALVLLLNIHTLDVSYYCIPDRWKFFHAFPRRRDRVCHRYHVTDIL